MVTKPLCWAKVFRMEGSSSSSLWAFVNDAVAEDRSALNRLLLLVPTASEVALASA
jgi:hypothetical protein